MDYRSTPTLVVRMIITEPYTAELRSILLDSHAKIIKCDAYITNWCAHSRRTQTWLSQNQIPFNPIDIERDREAASRVQTWNKGYLSTPTLDIVLCAIEPSMEELKIDSGLWSSLTMSGFFVNHIHVFPSELWPGAGPGDMAELAADLRDRRGCLLCSL